MINEARKKYSNKKAFWFKKKLKRQSVMPRSYFIWIKPRKTQQEVVRKPALPTSVSMGTASGADLAEQLMNFIQMRGTKFKAQKNDLHTATLRVSVSKSQEALETLALNEIVANSKLFRVVWLGSMLLPVDVLCFFVEIYPEVPVSQVEIFKKSEIFFFQTL